MNSSVLTDPRPRIALFALWVLRPTPQRWRGVGRARTYGHAAGLARAPWDPIQGRIVNEVVAVPRLFVALDLPRAVKQSLEPLAKGFGDVRWLAPEQQHL